MATKELRVRPFTAFEYALLQQFLSGESNELEVLRWQLDSLRYESPFYRPYRFLGIPFCSSNIIREKEGLKFKVGWGVGSEDWLLGEHRHLKLTDVVARLSDEHYLCAELLIFEGRLMEIRYIGIMPFPGGCLEPIKYIPNQTIVDFFFAGHWDASEHYGPHELSERRLTWGLQGFIPPESFSTPTPFQTWLLEQGSLRINPADALLPRRLRRARPATFTEINDFEREHGIVIPNDLRELWMLTNGAAFFGNRIRGTYDSTVVEHDGRKRILFSESFDNPGLFMLITPEQGTDDEHAVYEEAISLGVIHNKWSSLQKALEAVVARKMSRSTPPLSENLKECAALSPAHLRQFLKVSARAARYQLLVLILTLVGLWLLNYILSIALWIIILVPGLQVFRLICDLINIIWCGYKLHHINNNEP